MQEPSEESKNLQKRAASVFDLAYRRFEDLKKAEEQAREAQIEVALERIRARALAMHSSDEIQEVANVLREQMGLLGQSELEVSAVHVYPEGAATFESWWAMRPGASSKGKIITGTSQFRIKTSALAQEWIDMYHSDQSEYTVYASGKNLRDWQKEIAFGAPEITKYWGDKLPKEQYCHFSDFSGGSLIMVSMQEPSEEEKNLQKRSASVFNLAYKRFLDLKKAEAQTRQARIEAALEKVRSASMAMHQSEGLINVITVVFEQFHSLGIDLDLCFINVFQDNSKDFQAWTATGAGSCHLAIVPYFNHEFMSRMADAREKEEVFYTQLMSKRSKDRFMDHFYQTVKLKIPQKRKNYIARGAGMAASVCLLKDVSITLSNYRGIVYGEEDNQILRRISKVFEQSYTRFLDLKQAEAQAREAQIEASLERVRAKAMAMHSSEDLTETVGQLFHELNSLNVSLLRCGVGRIHKDKRCDIYTFSSTKKGAPVPVVGKVVLMGHPVLDGYFQSWEKQEEFHAVLKGASLKKYYQALKADYKLPGKQDSQVQYGYSFPFSAGCLYTFTETELTEEELSIFRKFTSVVGLTYMRFLDLQDAEAQAR